MKCLWSSCPPLVMFMLSLLLLFFEFHILKSVYIYIWSLESQSHVFLDLHSDIPELQHQVQLIFIPFNKSFNLKLWNENWLTRTNSKLSGLAFLRWFWCAYLIFWSTIWCMSFLLKNFVQRLTWINFWSHIPWSILFFKFSSSHVMVLVSLWSSYDESEVFLITW